MGMKWGALMADLKAVESVAWKVVVTAGNLVETTVVKTVDMMVGS